MKIKYLCLILLAPVMVQAQSIDTLIAGTSLKRAKTIQRQSHQYFLYFIMPDGKNRAVGLETRSVELLLLNGEPTWAFVQKYQTEKAVDADTTFFKAKTLLPVAYRTNIASQNYREVVDFEAMIMKNKIIYKDSVKEYNKDVALNYYNAPMADYVYEKLPLKEGYSITFRSINTGKNYFDFKTKITVTGSDKIQLPDGKTLDCWVLEEDNGFSKSVLWYTKKEQEFIKRKFGSEAKGIFWEVRLY